jgi:hypothetical protein
VVASVLVERRGRSRVEVRLRKTTVEGGNGRCDCGVLHLEFQGPAVKTQPALITK